MKNKNEPLIIWEKWVDPFGQELDDAKWTDYESSLSLHTEDAVEEYVDEDEDDEDIDEEIIVPAPKTIRAIASPMGIIPYNELTAPGKIFNFWVGHTNFNISLNIAKIIEQCEGVEILDIFTRYRFRIGVGKCFNDAETMSEINSKLYQAISNEQ
jgi:hypothetical protein